MNFSVTRGMLLLALPLTLYFQACQKKAKGDDVEPPGAPSPVELRFEHVVTPYRILSFDSTYPAGLQMFKVTDFKYYISNIFFVSSDGDTVRIPDTYFLIDERKPASKKVLLTVPADEYYLMSFLIGVDSARNAGGAQTGALDPALGMFWDRNNGYIMAKLEGTSPASPLPGNVFSYHVGGYKSPYNVLARRHFKIGTQLAQPSKKLVLNMTSDVRAWFSVPHTISFATDPMVNTPGDLAKKISENYYKMFDFISAKYE